VAPLVLSESKVMFLYYLFVLGDMLVLCYATSVLFVIFHICM
jgi:hypothetical protein